MSEHYDLIVIGSGPAGEKGAAQVAYHGKRVAVIEKADIGGAGINTGTLPSKTLRETALYFSGLRQRGLYGIDYSLKEGLTVRDFMYRKQEVIHEHWIIIERNIRRHNIDLIYGTASLKDDHTVSVLTPEREQIELTADFILIATGSSPQHPAGIPFDDEVICDSDSILRIDQIPKTMAIIGGGVIGSEYACIFGALGVQVILIDGRDRLLPFVDSEISAHLRKELERIGLQFRFNTKVDSVEVRDGQAHLVLNSGETVICDIALIAAGRKSNVEGLCLEEVGIELGKNGLVKVNDHYQTTVPHIYAAGDVIGFPALASTSMEQARVAMVHAFNLHYKEKLSSVVPLAVYTIPEIALAGLTEEQCQEKGIAYLVGRWTYDRNARGQIIGDTHGMVKLIFSPEDRKLLGVHWIGEMASELVHLGANEIEQGGTIDTFIKSVYNYPTLSDAYKYAAYDGLQEWEKWSEAQKAKA